MAGFAWADLGMRVDPVTGNSQKNSPQTAGIAEASSRQGADRLCRFRCARGEACEAAAALEGVFLLNLAPQAEILTLLALLDRLCAMLTRWLT